MYLVFILKLNFQGKHDINPCCSLTVVSKIGMCLKLVRVLYNGYIVIWLMAKTERAKYGSQQAW